MPPLLPRLLANRIFPPSRELKVQYEVALTLRAMAVTGYSAADDLAAESEETLERLGVVSLPSVPLP